MGDDDLICICMTVTRGEIKAALRRGNKSLDELKSSLFCCTGCGTCEGRVRKIMDEEELSELAQKEAATKTK